MGYPESMPWWQSRVIVGALISAIFKVIFAALVLFGHPVDYAAEELAPLIDALVLIVSLLGDLIAGRARLAQVAAPAITLTKAP